MVPRIMPALVMASTIAVLSACSSDSSESQATSTPESTATGAIPPTTFSAEATTTFSTEGSVTIKVKGLGDAMEAKYVDPGSGGTECYGANAYSYVRSGETVTLSDAEGTTVALGRLSPGLPVEDPPFLAECVFTFELADVPESAFYSMQIGSAPPFQFAAAEVRGGIDLVLR